MAACLAAAMVLLVEAGAALPIVEDGAYSQLGVNWTTAVTRAGYAVLGASAVMRLGGWTRARDGWWVERAAMAVALAWAAAPVAALAIGLWIRRQAIWMELNRLLAP
jgi:hypothetical protein